jgi:hypothetical protein
MNAMLSHPYSPIYSPLGRVEGIVRLINKKGVCTPASACPVAVRTGRVLTWVR